MVVARYRFKGTSQHLFRSDQSGTPSGHHDSPDGAVFDDRGEIIQNIGEESVLGQVSMECRTE
jgi:hypothetical protein